jgi:hypothetical protein
MRHAMEHAIITGHNTSPLIPNAALLIIPRWERTQNKTLKYIHSPTHNIDTFFETTLTIFFPPDQHTPEPVGTKWKMDIYLVAKPVDVTDKSPESAPC